MKYAISALVTLASLASAAMPTGFAGQNNGIGSWFRADASGDSTNGNSWCGFPYSDSSPGFAPDISVMTNGANSVYSTDPKGWAAAASEYCGLEAEVTDPASGKTMSLYIIDAFDHKWVRKPGSIDIMIDAWKSLSGRSDLYDSSNTKTVEMQVSWKLTGRKSAQWSFKGPGSKGGDGAGQVVAAPAAGGSSTTLKPSATSAVKTTPAPKAHESSSVSAKKHWVTSTVSR